MKVFLTCFFISIGSVLLGQTSIISVYDSITQKPIEFAHVIFTHDNGSKSVKTTNQDGVLSVDLTAKTYFNCSFIGYSAKKDSIAPGQTKKILLKPGNFGINEVVLTGQIDPVSEKNSVYKVKVINQEQITHRGAITLNQLLNDQLNIRIGQDNALGSTIDIQGLGGENVKILIDGIPIVGRQDGNIDLSQLNLDNIEKIEIIEGPLSVAYGSSAIAGTINLITKKPVNNTVSGSAKALYESVGYTNLDANLNVGLKKQAFRVNVGRNFFGGWDPNNDTRNQQWNQKEQILGSFGYDFNWGKSKIDLSTQGLHEVIKDKGNRLGSFSDYALDTWFTTRRLMSKIAYTRPLKENRAFNISFTHNLFWRSKITYNRNLVSLEQAITPNPADHDTTLFMGYNVRATYPFKLSEKVVLQSGLDLNYETGEGGRISRGTRTMGDYAVFTSASIKHKNLTLQPGVRWAYNSVFNSPIVPSLFAKYQLGDHWSFRGSYAMGFRAPSLKELYMEFVDANHNILGNEDLSPEKSHNTNLSFQYLWSDKKGVHSLKVEPTLFYNFIHENIALIQVQGTQFAYRNIDQMETFGAKLVVNYNIHPDYQFKLGYSHLGFTNQNYKDHPETDPYLFTPEVVAGFDYWRSSKKFNFNITYKYTGNTPGYTLDDKGALAQTNVPGYNMLDISATQKIWKNRISITAGGKNLFNVQNLQTTANTGGAHSGGGSRPISWGRTFFVSCKLNL